LANGTGGGLDLRLTPRGGRPSASASDFEVPSARPRRPELVETPEFAELDAAFKNVALPILTALAVFVIWELAADLNGTGLFELASCSALPQHRLLPADPKIALAPLFIVWLGIGAESRATFAVFISLFPVVIATIAGLTNLTGDMLRLCRALTASNWQIFRPVRFPYALPSLRSRMKIAITFAIIGVVVGEFIAANKGLGYRIMFASSMAETTTIVAAIAVLGTIGLGLFGLASVAERIVLKASGHKAV
jgi:ABC-type proline/glycine betaine transport system permease subunit